MNTNHGSRPVVPRPDVTVTANQSGGTDLVISRDGKATSHQIEAPNRNEAVKEAVEKVLNDPRSAEWLP